MEYTVTVIRSDRKTVSLSIAESLEILVRAPQNMSDSRISELIAKHSRWIEKHFKLQKERNEKRKNQDLSEEQIGELKEKARTLLKERVDHYSQVMGVTPIGLKITSATTRWGSCSGKNSLCFSYRTALLPQDLIDYIVVHELAHIRVKNHGKRFYQEIERVMPDYQKRIRDIKRLQREEAI